MNHLAILAAAAMSSSQGPQVSVRSAAPSLAPKAAAKMPAKAPLKTVAGTWLLNGTDRSTRLVFAKNSTFSYAGWGATSRGKWKYDGSTVTLIWTQVDGKAVPAGRMRKSCPVTPEGELIVDKYRYRRP